MTLKIALTGSIGMGMAPIRNTPVAAEARTAPAAAPSPEETKPRVGQSSTFVSLEPKAAAPEPETPAAVAPPAPKLDAPKPEKPTKAAARKAEREKAEKDKAENRAEKKAAEKRQATRKTAAAKPADEAPATAPAAASPASDDADIPGARQIRDGFKAIGGLFGKSDAE